MLNIPNATTQKEFSHPHTNNIPTAEKEVINHGGSLQRNITIKYRFNPQRDWIYAMLLQKEYVNFSLSPYIHLKYSYTILDIFKQNRNKTQQKNNKNHNPKNLPMFCRPVIIE